MHGGSTSSSKSCLYISLERLHYTRWDQVEFKNTYGFTRQKSQSRSCHLLVWVSRIRRHKGRARDDGTGIVEQSILCSIYVGAIENCVPVLMLIDLKRHHVQLHIQKDRISKAVPWRNNEASSGAQKTNRWVRTLRRPFCEWRNISRMQSTIVLSSFQIEKSLYNSLTYWW